MFGDQNKPCVSFTQCQNKPGVKFTPSVIKYDDQDSTCFWRQIQMFQCFYMKWCIKNAIECFHNSDPNFGVIKTPSGVT